MTRVEKDLMTELQNRLEHAVILNRTMAREIAKGSHRVQFLLDELRRLSPEWWEKWNEGEIKEPPFEE